MKMFVSLTIIFIIQTSCSLFFTLSTDVFSSTAALLSDIISSANARYTIRANLPEVSGIENDFSTRTRKSG